MIRKLALAALPALLISSGAEAQFWGSNSDQDFQKQQEAVMKQGLC